MVRTYRKPKISEMNVMERTLSIINIIPASTFLRLYLDDIMYPISYDAQRLGSDQVRNTSNEWRVIKPWYKRWSSDLTLLLNLYFIRRKSIVDYTARKIGLFVLSLKEVHCFGLLIAWGKYMVLRPLIPAVKLSLLIWSIWILSEF